MNPEPQGYLAEPATGTGPGVLVLHAWWGLNDTMRSLCDRLASEGFVAFAPDLYRGAIATTIEEAESLSAGLDESRAKADISGAVDFLVGRAGAGSGIGVMGFSLGAYFALDLSTEDPERVRCVVVFYGTGPTDFSGSRAAYLGHFAENDPYEPSSYVDALEDALRAAGRAASFHRYEDTGHWFFEPDRSDAYIPAAAELAWQRTTVFLHDQLG